MYQFETLKPVDEKIVSIALHIVNLSFAHSQASVEILIHMNRSSETLKRSVPPLEPLKI